MRKSWLLTLDTSSSRGGVALARFEDGSTSSTDLFVREYDASTSHAERILSEVRSVLAEAGATFEQIAVVGVSVGPGSFTGVRAGVATAKGLALAVGARIVTATSLEVVARSVAGSSEELRAAVIDARRGEVYVAVFDDTLREVVAPAHLSLAAAADLLATLGRAIVVAGDGASLISGNFRVESASLRPDVRVLAALVAERATRGQFADSALLEPAYVRPADAIASVPLDPVMPTTLESGPRWKIS